MDTFSYVLYNPTASYGAKPRFISVRDSGVQGFISLYQVEETTAKAIESAGTTEGFKGVVWSPFLWIDVDSYEAAEKVEERLQSMELSYTAYDSGGRGAHFCIPRKAEPSHLLPARDKAWVKANFPEADTSIYTHLHPFRIPGTVHEKTGRVKEVVSGYVGKELELPPYEKRAMKVDPTPSGVSVFDCFRVMSNISPATRGDRHKQLVNVAFALKDDASVTAQVALWWVSEVNKRFVPPLEDWELEKLIRSVYGQA